LLNLLANREAAIVSPIAGTTRDVIEVTMDLGGVRCIVSDTAGVREDTSTGDIIEVEGMKRARKVAADAHVLVCMIDATDEEGGVSAINEVVNKDVIQSGQNVLLLRNKVDLLGAGTESTGNILSETDTLENMLSKTEQYQISCEKNTGVDDFIEVLTEKVLNRVTSNSDNDDDQVIEDDGAVITRARHRRHVMSAAEALHQFHIRSGEGYMALDLAAEELRLAASELGRITGAVDVEDVLDVLFSDFCIGK
jgi:tRNA modification GTPase